VTWSSVANFPYNNSLLEFSPSGEVGFALGINFQPLSLDEELDAFSFMVPITKSIDKGKTWMPEDIEESLYGWPEAIAIPSNDVAYILCVDKIIKYTQR
jgi:hypothetical protein